MALGRAQWVPGGSWVALASSLGGPGVAGPARAPRPRTYSLYRLEWTRALNARCQLASGEVAAAFVGFGRPSESLLNRVGCHRPFEAPSPFAPLVDSCLSPLLLSPLLWSHLSSSLLFLLPLALTSLVSSPLAWSPAVSSDRVFSCLVSSCPVSPCLHMSCLPLSCLLLSQRVVSSMSCVVSSCFLLP